MSERKGEKKLERNVFKENNISVSFRQITEHHSHTLHWHNYIEIEFVVGGQARHDLNGHEYDVRPGSVYILRPSDFHSIYTDSHLELYNLSISEATLTDDTLQRLARYGSGISSELHGDNFETAKALAELMLKEYKSEACSRVILQKLLDCFIIKVLGSISSFHGAETAVSDPLSNAITYINMHFIDDPSLNDAASVAHYNPSHFSTRFRAVMGVPYIEYLNTLKIEYSKQLLISTDLKISDIAFKSGFSSESNYLRTFKSKIGTSPLKFRNKYRK